VNALCCGRSVPVLLLAALANCMALNPEPMPVTSAEPLVPSHRLRAGFGRFDITPPPGVGLAGYGPEGLVAKGYRLRLYARALVIEDVAGERVALVVADLPLIPPLLHRLVAQRLYAESLPITADRLILSATHTHAGPSHFYSERTYNEEFSSLTGYDPGLLDFLATQITCAVAQAWDRRRDARVAWDTAVVWGHTRNRSYDAFLRNKPEWTLPGPPPTGLDPPQRAVDPTWTLLKVNLRGEGNDTAYYPAGAFSIFAIHGTGNPWANDLLDGDIQGIVERGLERHIDSVTDRMHRRAAGPPGYASRAVHVFANGAEGDVSADWPANSRCPLPTFRPESMFLGGARTPPAHWVWTPPPNAALARCVSVARAYINAVGDTLTARVVTLFERLKPAPSDFSVAVAFRTVSLRGPTARPELCERAEVGPPAMVGAEDGRTRLLGQRPFGIVPVGFIGFEEGGSAVKENPSTCHAEKRVMFDSWWGRLVKRWFLVGGHPYPDTTQLALVRLGNLLVGAVPAEATTMAGAQIMRAIRDSIKRVDPTSRWRFAIVNLANGYLAYVPTAAEYTAQDYEGGSDLFGPGTAAFLARKFGELAAALARNHGASPASVVTTFNAYPGHYRRIVDRSWSAPRPAGRRKFLTCKFVAETLVARWIDPASPWVPPMRQVLVIDTLNADHWDAVAWDDRPDVEVRFVKTIGALKRARHGKAVWEARWSGATAFRTYRAVLLHRKESSQPDDTVICK
jgi:neutral ceramidase